MMSKNLFFKRFKQDVEQRIWLPVILFVISFLFLEIALVSEFEWLKTRTDYVTRAVEFLTEDFFVPESVIGFLTVPAAYLCALTGFSFVHSSKKLDVYHSLPIKREKIFVQQYLYGIIYYVIPLLLHVLICLGITGANQVLNGQVLDSAFGFLFFQILLFLANFSVSVLAVCLTGSALISVLGSAIFMAYTLGLEVLASQLMDDYFMTYLSYGESSLLPVLSPLHLMYNFFMNIRWEDLLIYQQERLRMTSSLYYLNITGIGYILRFVVMIVVYTAISLLVYKKRASEAASRTIAFKLAEPVIKAMVVIPGTFLAGYLFSALGTYGNNRMWFYFGCAFGFVILCPIMEIIFRKDVKAILRHPLQILFNGVCILGILAILQFDLLGYDTYVPKADKTESYSIYLDAIRHPGGRYGYNIQDNLNEMALTDNESVRALLTYAAEITRPVQKNFETEENALYSSMYAKYQLKNGDSVYRRYVIDINNEQVQYWLGNIYDDTAYKNSQYPILEDEHAKQAIGLSLEYSMGEEVILLPADDMQQFVEAYQKELAELTVQDMIAQYPTAELGFIFPYEEDNITQKESVTVTLPMAADSNWVDDMKSLYGIDDYYIEYSYLIYPSFTETLALLESYGADTNTNIDPENIINISVSDYSYEADDNDGQLTKLVELEYTVENLTEEQLTLLFDSIVNNNMKGDLAALKSEYGNIDIRINFYNESGYEDARYFNFKNGMIPEFISEDLLEKAKEIGAISQ